MSDKTVSEHLRDSLFERASLVDTNNPDWLYTHSWDDYFECLMRNRLVMGTYRYGGVEREPRKGHTESFYKIVDNKLKLYADTGNTEMLVDLANMALMEYLMGDHPLKHFKALDRED